MNLEFLKLSDNMTVSEEIMMNDNRRCGSRK